MTADQTPTPPESCDLPADMAKVLQENAWSLMEEATPPAARIQEPYGQRGPEDVDFPWPRLLKPAHVCGATFGVGVSSRLVVECAQRHAKYRAEEGTKTPEQRQVDEANRRALWDTLNGNPDARNPLKDVLDEQRQRSVYNPALAHTQQPAAAQAKSEAVAKIVNGNLAWNLANQTNAVPVGLLYGEHLLYTAPQQEAERQPLSEAQALAMNPYINDPASQALWLSAVHMTELRHGITGPATKETAK